MYLFIMNNAVSYFNLNNIKCLFKTVAVAVDLRKPVYGRVICKAIDFNQVLSMMTKVNWEVKDIMCEHSRYVDYFLQVGYSDELILTLFSILLHFSYLSIYFLP